MSVTLDPKQVPTPEKRETIYEVEFLDATEVFVNDSSNSLKRHFRYPFDKEKKMDFTEVISMKIEKEGNVLKITDTYCFNPKAAPIKLTYTPRVNFHFIILLVYLRTKSNKISCGYYCFHNISVDH